MAKSRSGKVIIVASGQAATTLASLVTAAVLARLFTRSDYAVYRQTMMVYAVAAPFVALGFNQALLYFLPTESDRPRSVLVENLILLTLGGAVLTAFLLLGGNDFLAKRFDNPELARTLLILAPYPLLMLPAGSFSACLLARDRTTQAAIFNVASRLVILVAVLAPVTVWTAPDVAVRGLVGGSLITASGAMWFMFRACREGPWAPTLAGMRRQASYALPLGLATLVGTIDRSLDKVMVSTMCSPVDFAVYVNGAMEIPLIGIVTGSITSVLIVEYRVLFAEGRTDEALRLIHRAMIKGALILVPVMFILMILAPELMRVLYGVTYSESALPFRVYLLLLPIRTLTFGAILMATGRSAYVFVNAGLTLAANALLTYFAIHLFGATGAAIATVSAVYMVAVPFLTLILHRALNCRVCTLYPLVELSKIAAAAIAATLPVWALKSVIQHWADPLVLSLAGSVYIPIVIVILTRLRLVDTLAAATWFRSNIVARFPSL